jgi:hypothetical protein
MNNLEIKLISENYVKERSTVMSNVENTFIKNNILLAQDIHIQDALGSSLYDDIIVQFQAYKTDYDAGTTGITYSDYVDANYLTLIDDYVQPTLLYYTLYESVFDLYSKITNKGIVTQSSDYSETAADNWINKRKDDYLNKAEYYSQRLSNHLIDNEATYEKYTEYDGDESEIIPNSQNYLSNGWYLKSSGCFPKNNDKF